MASPMCKRHFGVPWFKEQPHEQHRTLIDKYRKRREHLCEQYTAAHQQLHMRHEKEMTKLNEYIREITDNFAGCNGPPQAKVEVRNCPRSTQAVQARHAKKKVELLCKPLFKRTSQLDLSRKTTELGCGVCWECQRAAQLSNQAQEKQYLWEQYSEIFMQLYDEFGKVVGHENLPSVPPHRNLEAPAGTKGFRYRWFYKPSWKWWSWSFSYQRRKS